MMESISSIDEIQFMLIGSRHILYKVYGQSLSLLKNLSYTNTFFGG